LRQGARKNIGRATGRKRHHNSDLSVRKTDCRASLRYRPRLGG
jgi:hypothetical protein